LMHGRENSVVHCGVISRSCMLGGCTITKWCMALKDLSGVRPSVFGLSLPLVRYHDAKRRPVRKDIKCLFRAPLQCCVYPEAFICLISDQPSYLGVTVSYQIPQIVASHQTEIYHPVSVLTQVHETINTSIPQKSGGTEPIAERRLILNIFTGSVWIISYRAGQEFSLQVSLVLRHWVGLK
jgi:hypothetical protein